ncbi:phosphohydrolase [Betaproteobacteria bacterium GR16-43]|nr:phosphohydrolase [Betaproteobacteria bacterium GR16-43]
MHRLIRAIDFAAAKHRNQRRKDEEASPYINHPIALTQVLKVEAGVSDIDVLAAALLHDTIEDTETTAEELQREFGPRIAGIVAEVSDDTSLPKVERKRLQVEHAATLSREAKLVKLADKICNLRDMLDAPPAKWDLARRKEYFEWAKEVVDNLRGTHPRLEALFDLAYAGKP